MTTSQTAVPLFDPFAPGFTDDPYPQYAALRDKAPVYHHPMGFWLLSHYDDVSWLLRAPGLSVEDRLEQCLLASEVVVHGSPGHVGGGRDIFQRGAWIAAGGEQPGRRLQQR